MIPATILYMLSMGHHQAKTNHTSYLHLLVVIWKDPGLEVPTGSSTRLM
jgi:hypothetical protein